MASIDTLSLGSNISLSGWQWYRLLSHTVCNGLSKTADWLSLELKACGEWRVQLSSLYWYRIVHSRGGQLDVPTCLLLCCGVWLEWCNPGLAKYWTHYFKPASIDRDTRFCNSKLRWAIYSLVYLLSYIYRIHTLHPVLICPRLSLEYSLLRFTYFIFTPLNHLWTMVTHISLKLTSLLTGHHKTLPSTALSLGMLIEIRSFLLILI